MEASESMVIWKMLKIFVKAIWRAIMRVQVLILPAIIWVGLVAITGKSELFSTVL